MTKVRKSNGKWFSRDSQFATFVGFQPNNSIDLPVVAVVQEENGILTAHDPKDIEYCKECGAPACKECGKCQCPACSTNNLDKFPQYDIVR